MMEEKNRPFLLGFIVIDTFTFFSPLSIISFFLIIINGVVVERYSSLFPKALEM